ncbi:MAG TPA: peptidase S10 [Mycobacteriales bacterium]|jgi:Carboxypeptidase C (cathepsin A)
MAEPTTTRLDGDGPNSHTGPQPDDDLVTTRHTLTVAGDTLAYTATAGRLVLREETHTDGTFDGYQPRAELFVVSYTLDGADPATRPVTFAFNGGPGSSSVWLHLGLLGPRRVLMGDAGALLPPPHTLVDNAESLLAHSDLVFVDPVSTGYSRTVPGGRPADYHGYRRDLESVGEVIRLWTTRNDRWLSPKFLAGESYGTLRAAALAGHLQQQFGMYLNGIILISSVLDMGTLRPGRGNDLGYVLYLPTYAAVAHHHGRHGDRPLSEVLAEAEDLAARDYPYALARGARLSAAERAAMVRRIAAVTGLDEDFVHRANLRVDPHRFFRELLRSSGLVVGRLDGRFTGTEADDAAEVPTHDPSYTAILGPYSAALNHYVRAELGYRNDLPYEILTDRVRPWSYQEFEGRPVYVADILAESMRHNPHLRVHVACGYHDGATAYHAAEYVLAHLDIPPSARANIEVAYYPAGHMMYVHEPSRRRQSSDLARFVTAPPPSPAG